MPGQPPGQERATRRKERLRGSEAHSSPCRSLALPHLCVDLRYTTESQHSNVKHLVPSTRPPSEARAANQITAHQLLEPSGGCRRDSTPVWFDSLSSPRLHTLASPHITLDHLTVLRCAGRPRLPVVLCCAVRCFACCAQLPCPLPSQHWGRRHDKALFVRPAARSDH